MSMRKFAVLAWAGPWALTQVTFTPTSSGTRRRSTTFLPLAGRANTAAGPSSSRCGLAARSLVGCDLGDWYRIAMAAGHGQARAVRASSRRR